MPKARKDKDGDRLHAEGPPPISATEKAKVKEQEEVLKAPAAEPMIVVDKPDNDGKTPAHSPAAPKTPEVEKRTLDVREGERSSSPVVRFKQGAFVFLTIARLPVLGESSAELLAPLRAKHHPTLRRRR